MIEYTFPSTKNLSGSLPNIVSALENAFPGLLVHTPVPSEPPTASSIVQVHGNVAIVTDSANQYIVVQFFEGPNDWPGFQYPPPTTPPPTTSPPTTPPPTITFVPAKYASIPSASSVQAILNNAGFL